MKGISVIIPTYNRQRYIVQAIDSVLAQNYEGNLELIVSDDGSTDGTLTILKTYGDKIRILLKSKDCNVQGASGARNRGIKAAVNPYICFLDSDDFFLRGHLNKMVAAIEGEQELGFAFCRLLEMDEKSGNYRRWTKLNITPRDISNLIIAKHNVIQTNGFIFKKEVFDNIGMFDESLRNAEDIDLWMKVSELHVGGFSDHFGAVIRKHNMFRLTDTSERELLKTYRVVYKEAIKRYFKLKLHDHFRIIKLIYVYLKYTSLQYDFIYKIGRYLRNNAKNTDIYYK